MLTIYGAMQCPDCVACRADLDRAGISYEYKDICEDLRNLKEFLKLRDSMPEFQRVKEEGKIGIPCILRENGSIALDWEEFLPM